MEQQLFSLIYLTSATLMHTCMERHNSSLPPPFFVHPLKPFPKGSVMIFAGFLPFSF